MSNRRKSPWSTLADAVGSAIVVIAITPVLVVGSILSN